MATRDAVTERALATTGRRRAVFDLLVTAPAGLSADDVAHRFGMHVTTARFHLDQLVAAGLVERLPVPAAGRGRPRLSYRAIVVDRADRARGDLITQLARALATAPDGVERARSAGRDWADAAAHDEADADARVGGAGPGEHAGPLPRLLRVLEDLDFAPEDTGAGTIELHDCPFRAAAIESDRIVCAVHLGLVQRTVERTGADPSTVQLHPFVEPELCSVTLAAASASPRRGDRPLS
jgi:predicted ArsR family transcriptional regulator